jgi:hypothetical protein
MTFILLVFVTFLINEMVRSIVLSRATCQVYSYIKCNFHLHHNHAVIDELTRFWRKLGYIPAFITTFLLL